MADTTDLLPDSELEPLVEDLAKYLAQASTNSERGSTPSVATECAKRIVQAIYDSFAHGRMSDIPGEAIEKSQELGRVLRSEGYQLRDVFQSIVLLRKSARDVLQTRATLLGQDNDHLQALTGRWFDGLVFAAVNAYYEAQRTELQRRIVVDGLTGVFNRGYFGERLSEELERARRYAHSVTLLMVDVDSLKPINDRFGHRAGDFVLKSVSQVLQAQSRLVDVVARYGGDEFAIIMPETGPDGGWILAERITKAIRENRGDQLQNLISVSIGIAAFPRDADTADELIESADKALYRCKSQGGNTVAAFGGPIADGKPATDQDSPKPAENPRDASITPDGAVQAAHRAPEIPGGNVSNEHVRQLETQNLKLKISLELTKRKLALYEQLEQNFQTIIEDCLKLDAPENHEPLAEGNGHELQNLTDVADGADVTPPLQSEPLESLTESVTKPAVDLPVFPDTPVGETPEAPASPHEQVAQVEPLSVAELEKSDELPSAVEQEIFEEEVSVQQAQSEALANDLRVLEQQREQARNQVEAVLNVINDLLTSISDVERKS